LIHRIRYGSCYEDILSHENGIVRVENAGIILNDFWKIHLDIKEIWLVFS